MFDSIHENIKNYLNNHEKVTLKDFIYYGSNKIDIVLFSEFYAASLSILKDLTCDSFSIRIEDDYVTNMEVKKYADLETLYKRITFLIEYIETH